MTAPATWQVKAGNLASPLNARRRELAGRRFSDRLLAGDATLWPSPAEAVNRLGWLDLPTTMPDELPGFEELAREVAADGLRDIVLIGMGGSSLGAEVLSRVLASAEAPRLSIVDSTHPASVGAALDAFPAETSLYIAASKSGGTAETAGILEAFWHAAADHPDRGSRFVAITDPGSELARRGTEDGFRRVVLAPSNVGGRYSALSPFGLLPACLIGVDCEALLGGARSVLDRVEEAVELGALMAEAALAGRDKLTFIEDAATAPLLPWLEQLIAESLGKNGKGVVPVFGEASGVHYGPDRLFIRLAGERTEETETEDAELSRAGHPLARLVWGDPLEIGAEMMRWELATAVAGAILEVQPFDQPDVDLAKRLAKSAIGGAAALGDPPVVDVGDEPGLAKEMAQWLATAGPGDYISLQAFLPSSDEVLATVDALRANLAATGLPTTVGFGPRFLHSTGQLHKGGRPGVFCLQLFDSGDEELEVPGAGYTFRQLIDAQALGDARALVQRGRAVLRVRLGD